MRPIFAGPIALFIATAAHAQPPNPQAVTIAASNLGHEIVECASFHIIVAEAVKTRSGSEELSKQFQSMALEGMTFAIELGETIGQMPEAVMARFKMMQNAQLDTIGRNSAI